MKILLFRPIRFGVMLILAVALATGCGSGKHLRDGESFLFDNKVRVKSDEPIKIEDELKTDLEALYKQKPTRSLFGIPRHWYYYQGSNNPDSTKFKKWLQNKPGDPPVIYNEAAAQQTISVMRNYLSQRGFRWADLNFSKKTEKFETTVVYNVDPGKRMIIDTLTIFSRDLTIQNILNGIKKEAFLKSGSPLDIRLYNLERNRIAKELQNNGYPFLFQNYITNIEADTTDNQLRAVVEVRNPSDTTQHKMFRHGSISIYPDYTLNTANTYLDTIIGGIQYYTRQYPMLVKPEVINRNINITTGGIYKKEELELTSKKLSRLDIFKFASIKSIIDTTADGVLNYSVYLTRNKKMSLGGDIGLSYSTIAAARRSLIGTSFNIGFRHRNLMRGAEYFSSNLETGLEFNIGSNQDDLLNSINVNFVNSLNVPRFIDPINLYRRIGKLGKTKKNGKDGWLNRWFQEESTTNMSLGVNYLSLLNFYDYTSVNASFGYDMQPAPSKRLQINHIGINYFNPTIKERFQLVIDEIKFLEESFGKQLFTGFLFRDYSYTYNKEPNRNGFSWGIQHAAEISGAEILLLNSGFNLVTGRNIVFQLKGVNQTTEFSQFGKFDITYTLQKKLGTKSSFAFKLNTGLAFPYGPSSKQVPYVKQFFVGGALSNRAWVIRELGPGGFEDTAPALSPNNPFYQSGDILFDASLEYRFNLFWRINSALFLDAANVWTLKNDPARENANFTSNFLNEIALGYGFGFRVDFTYFLLRLDFGYKLRSPFILEHGSQWYQNTFKDFPRGGNPNFAVNYPF